MGVDIIDIFPRDEDMMEIIEGRNNSDSNSINDIDSMPLIQKDDRKPPRLR